jgi:hypothetical protein
MTKQEGVDARAKPGHDVKRVSAAG